MEEREVDIKLTTRYYGPDSDFTYPGIIPLISVELLLIYTKWEIRIRPNVRHTYKLETMRRQISWSLALISWEVLSIWNSC